MTTTPRQYRVTAPLIQIPIDWDHEASPAKDRHYYRGDILPVWVTSWHIEHLLDLEHIEVL